MKLLNYIQGLRKGKEAHRLEKEAMQDPFLADAMDGYDSTKENPVDRIETLRQQVLTRSVRKKKSRSIGWSIAACLLMGACISAYFLFQKGTLPEEMTMIAQDQSSQVVPAPKASTQQPSAEPVRKEAEPSLEEAVTEENKMVAPSTTPEPEADESCIVQADSREAKAVALPAHTGELRGKVTDQQGEPLIGATVVVKGTNRGTVSDIDGNFALKAEGVKEIAVNYIGYETITLPVDSSKNLLIAMNDDRQTLDEVVVVGYGSQKRQSITGAAAALKIPGKPQPTIGWKAFKRYLKENLCRPTDAECKRAKGKVILSFRVNQGGRPEDITVKKALCPSADEEAINLIEEGPDWTVGDEPVEVNIKF